MRTGGRYDDSVPHERGTSAGHIINDALARLRRSARLLRRSGGCCGELRAFLRRSGAAVRHGELRGFLRRSGLRCGGLCGFLRHSSGYGAASCSRLASARIAREPTSSVRSLGRLRRSRRGSRGSENANVLGARALRATTLVVGNLLPLAKVFEPYALDGRHVEEQVIP